MTDIEEMRKRYADFKRHCVCGATWEASEYTVLHQCPSCDGYETWQATRDPSVLALCDEVESLRAQVAAAPEVLKEWPAQAEDAPGEWVLVTRGIPISGEFGTADGVVYFVSWNNESIGADIMDPGEFFVRIP